MMFTVLDEAKITDNPSNIAFLQTCLCHGFSVACTIDEGVSYLWNIGLQSETAMSNAKQQQQGYLENFYGPIWDALRNGDIVTHLFQNPCLRFDICATPEKDGFIIRTSCSEAHVSLLKTIAPDERWRISNVFARRLVDDDDTDDDI